ncbi:hypothetical protein ES703_110848 [subsurface metagenome]
MGREVNITIRRGDDGQNEILYSSLEELQDIWDMMTKGFYIVGPDGEKKWMPPRDVFIEPDGEFRFKPKKEGNG